MNFMVYKLYLNVIEEKRGEEGRRDPGFKDCIEEKERVVPEN